MLSDAQSDPILSKAEYEKEEPILRTALLKAQYQQLEKANKSLLIVVAGIDGVGKGATINLLNEWMDPRHIHTMTFDPPESKGENIPSFRCYWDEMPAKGSTAIVFGSWYAELLREAVSKKPRVRWIAAYADAITRFEAGLAANGVQVVKLWFHISAEAQEKRTTALLSNPDTAWQVTRNDLKVQKKYDRLCRAGEYVINLLNPSHAPWTIIPSADERMRAVCTAKAVLHALQHRPRLPKEKTFGTPRVSKARTPNRLEELNYEDTLSKDDYESSLYSLQSRLAKFARSDAFKNRSLILVFEGQDAAGKGGAIRRVTRAFDLRQYDAYPISAPTHDELSRPYLWRFWRRMPRPGRIAIFDRSWYGRVLVERVEGYAQPAEWKRAYAEINDFERQQTDNGAIILKFWLAITPEEQLQRFHQRQRSAFKNFKITADDWRNREKWGPYVTAANDMFANTDCINAPWHVIPANDKFYARIEVLKRIVAALDDQLD